MTVLLIWRWHLEFSNRRAR